MPFGSSSHGYGKRKNICRLILIFCVQISANSYFGGQSLFSEPFGTSYRLLKVLFTVFTAAAGSPTSLLRKMKLQVSFMTSGSRMWSVYHGNHGSGNPPYECSRQKNLFLRILISRKEPSGIYGWSNDHDPCFSICFRIASFMEMEMAQLNDKFRLWHESDWIECTTCGGFQRPLSGPDLTDTKKKTCLYTNPLLVGRTTPNPQTSEKKTAVVLRYLGPAGFIAMKPSCIYWEKSLWKTGNARVEKKTGSTTLHTSAVSMVSGEFSRFFHQLYRISSCLHACDIPCSIWGWNILNHQIDLRVNQQHPTTGYFL